MAPISCAARRRRAREIRLHLPGPELLGCHIRELTLNLEAIRMPGRYPITFTLTPQGHTFPEIAAFAESLLAWCQATYRTHNWQLRSGSTHNDGPRYGSSRSQTA